MSGRIGRKGLKAMGCGRMAWILAIGVFGSVLAEGTEGVKAWQTTRGGDRLAPVEPAEGVRTDADRTVRELVVDPERVYQEIIGIGGSFTEAGAQALSELSEAKREAVLAAYFSPAGAHYSLTRTPVASCDFSVTNYTYAPVPGDAELEHFSIEPDRKYLLPMIKAAQGVEGAAFRIMASPWTAPPWMKTNGHWNAGELKPEHYPTFAAYMVKYLRAYAPEGIPVWGITPVNEPLGNGGNWESTHFTAEQMAEYVGKHLGPALEEAGLETEIWIYDQNRDKEMLEWAETIYGDPEAREHVDGMAVHWYQSTRDIGAEALDAVQRRHPGLPVLHSEGCIDAMGDDEPIGVWLEDDWYWRPEATDWGYIWAPDDLKKDHPPYRPFYRYARDLVQGLNHGLVGWIDWNMVLNTRGGPNHARNFCLAPVMVDSGRDHVYFTPLYYAVAHVSKFIRPGAHRIGLSGHDETFMATACRNPDGSIAVVVFNSSGLEETYTLQCGGRKVTLTVPGQAMQSVLFP